MPWFDGTTNGWPAVVVNAAFAAQPADVCVVDTGVVDTNTVGPRGLVGISADVRSVRWSRGREIPTDSAGPGTATVVVNNTSGDYDPTNLSGPYVDGGATLVTLGAAVTIQAERPAGMLYDRFIGVIVDIELDAGLDPTVTFTLADGLEQLGRVFLATETPVFAGDYSGERIGNLADRAGWPATARRLDTGRAPVAPTVLGSAALELMRQTELSELGLLFADEHGDLVFYDRHREQTANRSVTVQATLTDTSGTGELGMVDLLLSTSLERVFNDAHLTRMADPAQDPDLTGGEPGDVPVEQSATDSTSTADLGTLSFGGSAGQVLASDPDVLALAQGIVARYATPQPRIRQVQVDALHPRVTDEDLWGTLLGLTLLDRISVSRDYGPNTIAAELLIQQVTEEIASDPPQWRLTFSTSEVNATEDFCTLDEGVVDTDLVGW